MGNRKRCLLNSVPAGELEFGVWGELMSRLGWSGIMKGKRIVSHLKPWRTQRGMWKNRIGLMQ